MHYFLSKYFRLAFKIGICAFFVIFLFSVKLTAQVTCRISGYVYTFEKYPLSNVVLTSQRTGTSVLSDTTGWYTLTCAEDDILEASAVGFKKKSLHIKNNRSININLVYENKKKSQDEAVSHGHIHADTLKNILERIISHEKDYSVYRDLNELISAQFPSIKVTGSRYYSRKPSSFMLSSEVLYVVDDVITSDISYIEPRNIKTIEYLDDSSASAYGMQGANGVLKITLKN